MELRQIMMLLNPKTKVILGHYISGDVLESCTADELMRSEWYATMYKHSIVHAIYPTGAKELIIAVTSSDDPEETYDQM